MGVHVRTTLIYQSPGNVTMVDVGVGRRGLRSSWESRTPGPPHNEIAGNHLKSDRARWLASGRAATADDIL